jgi:hypothetical protein
LDAHHPLIAVLFFALAATTLFIPTPKGSYLKNYVGIWKTVTCCGLVCALLSGGLMILKMESLSSLTRLSYAGLEIGLVIALCAGVMALFGLINDQKCREIRKE